MSISEEAFKINQAFCGITIAKIIIYTTIAKMVRKAFVLNILVALEEKTQRTF